MGVLGDPCSGGHIVWLSWYALLREGNREEGEKNGGLSVATQCGKSAERPRKGLEKERRLDLAFTKFLQLLPDSAALSRVDIPLRSRAYLVPKRYKCKLMIVKELCQNTCGRAQQVEHCG